MEIREYNCENTSFIFSIVFFVPANSINYCPARQSLNLRHVYATNLIYSKSSRLAYELNDAISS